MAADSIALAHSFLSSADRQYEVRMAISVGKEAEDDFEGFAL